MKRFVRTIALSAAVGGGLLCSRAPAGAPPPNTPLAPGAPVVLPAPALATSGQWPAADTILGAGVAGPYYLSRTGIVPETASVQLNGEPQLPVIDYQLSPATGSITFTHVVRAQDAIQVHYWYDAATSRATAPRTVASALDVPLLGLGRTSVQLLGAYSLGGPGNETSQGFASMGMALSEAAGKNTSIGARVFLAPAAGPLGSSRSQTPLQAAQTALSLNGQTLLGGLNLSGSWSGAGKSFADSKAVGASAGSTVESLALTGPVGKGNTLDAGLTEQRTGSQLNSSNEHVQVGIAAPGGTIALNRSDTFASSGSSAGSVSTTGLTAQEKLGKVGTSLDAGIVQKTGPTGVQADDAHVKVGIATSGGSITLTRQATATGPASQLTHGDVTTVGVQQNMGASVVLKMDGKMTGSSSGADHSSDQTGDIGLTVKAAKNVTVGVVETRDASRSSGQGAVDSASHALSVNVGTAVQANASLTQTGLGRADGTTDREVGVQVHPNAVMTLTAAEDTHADRAGTVDRTQSVGAAIKEGTEFDLSTKVTDSSGRSGDLRSSLVMLGFNPSPAFLVKLNSTETDSTAAGLRGQRSVGVQVGPTKVKVTGNLTEQYGGQNAEDSSLLERVVSAGLALDPSKAVHLDGGYSEDIKGAAVQESRSVDARLAPVKTLQVNGRYVDRTSASADVPDTATVSVGFHPNKILNVDGSYTQNPDDAKGNLTLALQRSLAVKSTFGFLDLSGTYSQVDPAGPAASVLSRDFELGLNFNPHTRLYSDYQSSSKLLSPDGGLYLYKLGFSHQVSNIFSFSMDGQVQTDDTGMDGFRSGLRSNSQAKIGLSARW